MKKDYNNINEEIWGEIRERENYCEKQRVSELQERGIDLSKYKEGEAQYDDPYTMENGTATFLYTATMLIGALFVDRLLIWGAATLIYKKFINRHKKKK